MGRGKGKGKGRGGGKMFVANIEELQMREAQVEEAKQKRKNRRGDSDDEDDSGDDVNITDEVDTKEDLRELANFERASRLKKASGESETENVEDDKPRGGLLGGFQTANSNRGSKNPKQMKTKDMLKNMGSDNNPEPQLSRREREELEAQRKKADYERRHAAGETAEAKADLARLAEVRKRREEAKAKREKEEARLKLIEAGLPVESDDDDDNEDEQDEGPKKSKISAEKKASNLAKKKAAATQDTSEDIPVLSSIEIKKLKPDMLKEHLKKRGLSTQGQKKDLITRLSEHEASRK